MNDMLSAEFHPETFFGNSPPPNFETTPKNFSQVGNYNLNKYSTRIC